jgi:signal transduction histidine kinase
MKKKTWFLFVFLQYFLSVSTTRAAETTVAVDSLLIELEQASTTLVKAKLLYNIGVEYLHTDKTECLFYFDQAEALFKDISDEDELIIDFYYTKGLLLRSQNDYKGSDSLYDLAIYYARKYRIDTLYHIIHSLDGKALNYFYKGEYDKSLMLFSVLDEKFKEIDTSRIRNKKLLMASNTNRAILLANMGNLSDAFVFFKTALQSREELFNPNDILLVEGLIGAINNVALCYDLLNQPEKAIEYYFKALKVAEKHGLQKSIYLLHSNLSSLFLKQSDYEKCIKYALLAVGYNHNYNFSSFNYIGIAYLNMNELRLSNTYFLKALQESEHLNRPKEKCSACINLALNYIEFSKLDSALLFLTKAKEINRNLRDEFISLRLNNGFGKYYARKGMYDKSLAFLIKAEDQASKLEAKSLEHFEICDELYKINRTLGNSEESLYWLELKYQINTEMDSLRNIEAVNEIEAKYQSQQKENKILKLSNENIKKEAELTKSKYISYGITLLLLLLVGLTYLFWSRQQHQQKLALLKSALSAGEAEKNRIGKELHDGIAGSLLKIVYETDKSQPALSNQLLETYDQVRNISHQLEGTPIHNELFFDRLLELIPENKDGKVFKLKISPNHLALKEPYGTHVYRIIQELLTNNLKHAKASKTDLEVVCNNEVLHIHYKDNGIGTKNIQMGNGLHHIKNRLELLDGNMDVSSGLNTGFQVKISIPYKFNC